MDCLFCKIADKSIESDLLVEKENCLAFRDINPQAPHHILIIPRKHIATINDITPDDHTLLGEMIQTAKDIAADLDIAEPGYRLLFNINSEGGQAVYHIHLHLMGGRQMSWPPG